MNGTGPYHVDSQRRIKKKRRRKLSKSKAIHDGTTSECTDDSSDETECNGGKQRQNKSLRAQNESPLDEEKTNQQPTLNGNGEETNEAQKHTKEENAEASETSQVPLPQSVHCETSCDALKCDEAKCDDESTRKCDTTSEGEEITSSSSSSSSVPKESREETKESPKCDLKPDAQEFIPKAYRQMENVLPPMEQQNAVQYVNFQPGFVPIPMINPMGDISPIQAYPAPAFLPPGIPINFVPPNAKIVPNFINVIPDATYAPKNVDTIVAQQRQDGDVTRNTTESLTVDNETPKTPTATPNELSKVQKVNKTDIDIARIVSKLEQAAKEQRQSENSKKYVRKYNKTRYQSSNNYQDRNKNPADGEERYKNRSGFVYKRQQQHNGVNRINAVDSKHQEVSQNVPKQEVRVTETPQNNENVANNTHINNENVANQKETFKNKPIQNCSNNNKKKTPNYSDSLKSQQCPRFERHLLEKTPKPAPESAVKQAIVSKIGHAPKQQKATTNQWISVSSRRKRKNKGGNEGEENEIVPGEEEEESVENKDAFESYDVSLLVDVVPITAKENEEEDAKVNETNVEEVHQEVESKEVDEITVIDVRDIEKELLKEESHTAEEVVNIQEVTETIKRKPKKSTQKSLSKRIIIKDTFVPEIAAPSAVAKKAAESSTVVSETKNEPETTTKIEEVTENTATVEEIVVPEVVKETNAVDTSLSTPDKRNKKKKKKPTRPLLSKSQSVSSSNTTINNLDDSYDFLLENSILDDGEDKTNVEISQELDRMIQKGIYSNLEEKMRSLNVDLVNDTFFNTLLNANAPPGDKNGDFSSLLKNTAQLFNRPKRNEDFNKINIDFSKIKLPTTKEPQPSTSKTGIFVENPQVNEILKNVCDDLPKLEVTDLEVATKKSKSNGKLKNKSKKNSNKSEEHQKKPNTKNKESKNDKVCKEIVSEPQVEEELPTKVDDSDAKNAGNNLYPITKAVKEWMTKTRENTPEVEILKSPRRIYKEFCENEKQEDDSSLTNGHRDVEDEKQRKNSENDEDITIFSTEDEPNLLECWENDPEMQKTIAKQNGQVYDNRKMMNGDVSSDSSSLEEAEDVIEVYESKYGKNEDFLKLQAEIKEKKEAMNFPKHGNLPYRAICCSIM